MPRVRFAPSPTGFLHLGHAYSAWFTWNQRASSEFLLRIEDIDQQRSRPEYESAIFEDLSWLGLTWPHDVLRQSTRFAEYQAAADSLRSLGVLYRCFCTRKMLASEAAPHDGLPSYSGLCRGMDESLAEERAESEPFAWRLDMAASRQLTGALRWTDMAAGEQNVPWETLSDPIIARKDTPASYHLCVTLDDAHQKVELVTRGRDLFESTHIHRVLQALLGLPNPQYRHHPLVIAENGQRLAKRTGAKPIREYREAGFAPQQLIAEAERWVNET